MEYKGRRKSTNVESGDEYRRNTMEETTRVLKNIERKSKNPDRSGWIERGGEKPDLTKGRRWNPAKDSLYENL